MAAPPRADSVLAGVEEVSGRAELIAVHDGARPLVTVEVIDEAIRKAAECGAAAPAVPVKDTVKRAVGGVVVETPDGRSSLPSRPPRCLTAICCWGRCARLWRTVHLLPMTAVLWSGLA